MKIKELLVLTGLLVCVESFAAVDDFEVVAPSWKHLTAPISDDGVNIRKLPSTLAPKLVYNENNIEYFDVPLSYYGYWSSKPAKAPIYAVKFTNPAPVVSEKDGWYEIKNIGPKCESNGWVSGKFCKLITPTPLSNARNSYSGQLKWLSTGSDEYNGAYALYLESNEMEGTAIFYLGRQIDGMLVCPYSFYMDYYEEPDSPYQIVKHSESNSYMLKCPTWDVDISNIPVDILSFIFDKMEKDESTIVVCDVDGYLMRFGY